MCGILLVLLCAVVSIQSSSITELGPCRKDDSVCFTKLFGTIFKDIAVGIPSMNIKSLDPIQEEEIVANLATLKYRLKNNTLIGFKQCEVIHSSLNLEDLKLHLDFKCPFFALNGDYDIDGTIFGLLIKGNGDYRIESKDYRMTVNSDIKVTRGNGNKEYISVKNFKVTSECHGGALIDLRNLFNGNKELAEPVLKFMNDNWKPVTKELDEPVFEAMVKIMLKNYNKYFKLTPLDKFIL